jgi:hypothetical protein
MAMKQRADVVTDGGIADDIVRNAPASGIISFWCRRWSSDRAYVAHAPRRATGSGRKLQRDRACRRASHDDRGARP